MHQDPGLFDVVGDQSAIHPWAEKEIEDPRLILHDGPQIGLEMDHHEVGDAFRTIHRDPHAVANGATGAVTGDDVPAADFHRLLGRSVPKA